RPRRRARVGGGPSKGRGGGAAAVVRSNGKHSLCERGGPARPRFTRTHSSRGLFVKRRGGEPAPVGVGSRREWRTRGGFAASQSEFERMTAPPRAPARRPRRFTNNPREVNRPARGSPPSTDQGQPRPSPASRREVSAASSNRSSG